MGGPAEIRAWSVSEKPLAMAIDEVHRLELKYSRYLSDSVVSRINRRAGQGKTAIDVETAALLRYADNAWTASDGMFDITSGILRKVWDFKQTRIPDQTEIDSVLPLIGWEKVVLRDDTIDVPGGMEIDFGGIVKEYAADRAATVLREQGVEHALVELAGDIAAAGPFPDGSVWHIRVRHPRSTTEDAGVLELSEGGIATSGDYERCITLDGRRYSHILDPRTGWPVQGMASATVRHDTCTAAGTLATIAVLKGTEGDRWLAAQRVESVCIPS